MNENKEGFNPGEKNITRRNFLKILGVVAAGGITGFFGGKRVGKAEGATKQDIIPKVENASPKEDTVNIELPGDFDNPEEITGNDGKRYVFGHQGNDLVVKLENGEIQTLANTTEYCVAVNPGANTEKNPSGIEILISREFGGKPYIFWGEGFNTFYKISNIGHDPRSLNLLFNQTETGETVRSYLAIAKNPEGKEVPYFGWGSLGFEAQVRPANIDASIDFWTEIPILGFGELLQVQAMASGADINLLFLEKEIYEQQEIQTGWLMHGLNKGKSIELSRMVYSIGKDIGKSIFKPVVFPNRNGHGANTLYFTEGQMWLSVSENNAGEAASAGETAKTIHRQKQIDLGQQTGKMEPGRAVALNSPQLSRLYDILVEEKANVDDCLISGAEIKGKATAAYVFKSLKELKAKRLETGFNLLSNLDRILTLPGEILSIGIGNNNKGFIMYQDGEARRLIEEDLGFKKVFLPQIAS